MTGPTWRSDDMPSIPSFGVGGMLVGVLRGFVLLVVLVLGLLVLLALRLFEKPFFGLRRPWTPWITVGVCRVALRVIGLRVRHSGRPMQDPGMVVANHSSWLDIFILNSAGPMYFVSKSEVAQWPGIGWLARATGTVFVKRDRRTARAQKVEVETRLRARHRLLLFPEGTSSDGQRVLPFKPTLFAALFTAGLEGLSVQPASVSYHAPKWADRRFYGWWGDMDLGPHLFRMLGTVNHGDVEVAWHDAVGVSEVSDRKTLSASMENAVRSGHKVGRENS